MKAAAGGLAPAGRVETDWLSQIRDQVGPGISALEAAHKVHDAIVVEYERRFSVTGNPLFIWECIRHLSALCTQCGLICPEVGQERFLAPLPPFAADYLVETAGRLNALVQSLPARQKTAKTQGKAHRTRSAATTLTDRVPEAMGFRWDGGNALAEMHKIRVDGAIVLAGDILGMKTDDIAHALKGGMPADGMDDADFDLSAPKRKVARYRRLNGMSGRRKVQKVT